MQRIMPVVVVAIILLCGPALAGQFYTDTVDLPAEAVYVGSESCLDCHDDVGAFYADSPHAAERALASPLTGAAGCEACHGPGSLHVAGDGDGFILGAEQLGGLDEHGRVAMCTQCHGTVGTGWTGGPHDGADISCNDCHADQVHFGGKARPVGEYRNPAEFCLQCHPETVADFRMPFRHRALEGEVVCMDCHDPHAAPDVLGWSGPNAACLKCHTELSGPFVFEHDGVQGEECSACHRPHGSNHDKLLTQEGNSLCLQCHYNDGFNSDDSFMVGGLAHDANAFDCNKCHSFGGSTAPHTLLNHEGRCWDCHTDVHGSNHSPWLGNTY